MNEEMEVEIMLLVGSNGKTAACVTDAMGWGDLADSIMDWPEKGEPADPEAVQKHLVRVKVERPSIAQTKPISRVVLT